MQSRAELDRVRYMIDMHLLTEKDAERRDTQALRLANLARSYQEAGFGRDAICEMKRSLAIRHHSDHASECEQLEVKYGQDGALCPGGCGNELIGADSEICPHCATLLQPCRKCGAPNRQGEPFCRSCGARGTVAASRLNRISTSQTDWHYRGCKFSKLSPPPLAVSDLLIVPHVDDGYLLALKQSTGRLVWRVDDLGLSDRYTGLCYFHPYVYIHSTNRIMRFIPFLSAPKVETIYQEDAPTASFPALPYLCEEKHRIIFPVRSGLIRHDVRTVPMNNRLIGCPNDRRCYPIPDGQGMHFLSDDGKAFKYDGEPEILGDYLPAGEVAGPPVKAIAGEWVYLESSSASERRINAWLPQSKTLLSRNLAGWPMTADQLAESPPIPYRDGIVVVSQIEPTVYRIRVSDGHLSIKALRVDLQAGAHTIGVIDPQLSSLHFQYLFSRVPDGFFFINLDNPSEGNMMLSQIVIESNPVACGKRLFLLCEDGVRCFSLLE